MKHLSLLLSVMILTLLSCGKDSGVQPDSSPVIAIFEIKSTTAVPNSVIRLRLTELLTHRYTDTTFQSNVRDTAKAVLAISYKEIPKKFDALVSAYYKDGSVVNTEIKDIQLLKGKKLTCTRDIFKAGFQIGYNERWLEEKTYYF